MNVWIAITIILILTTARVGNGYEHDINGWRPLTPRLYRERPVDIITDVVNDLGIKILDCYIERPGNVAFSPAGLAFVLAALYEGSAGRGNRQIGHILGLPRDRRITRIGLRDIHRRLRNYLNADTFLGGLTLNRNDITLRPEYEDILRFYGFDIANIMDENVTTSKDNATEITTVPTNLEMIAVNNESNSMIMTTPSITTIGAAIVATTSSDLIASTVPNTVGINLDSTVSPIIITTPLLQVNPTIPAVTTNPSAELISITNGTDSISLVGNMMDSTTSIPLATSDTPTTLSPMSTLNPSTESAAETTTNGQNMSDDAPSLITVNEKITDINNATDDNQTRLMATTDNGKSSDDMQMIIPTVASVTTVNSSNQNNVAPVRSSDDNNVRKRRSIKHRRSFPIYQERRVWIDDLTGWQDYSSTIDDDVSGTPNKKLTQLNFLIHDCDISIISTSTYTAILPFAYFPSLRALALEFPLDDPRYNVIVFVPTEGNDSKTLNRLLVRKSLRQLRGSLRSTWIRAIIPSFMLRGFITLTPYLERLGIKDVFEPRNSDLSPMSPDLGIYARDVQQSIGVNIRNFMKDVNESLPTMSTTGNTYSSPGNIPHTSRTPIPFIADRPFLFFIVDNETSVSLIAGRVDDPLNSRIN